MRTWIAWPALAASLVLLNQSLTFGNVWPTPQVRWEWALSVELALVVLLLAATPGRARGWAGRVLPTLWVLLVAGRYLDVTAPGLYGRDFNLYWDSQHLGNVTAMLARAAPSWLIVAVLSALGLAVTVTWLASRAAFAAVAEAVTRPRQRRLLAALALGVLAAYAGAAASGRLPRDHHDPEGAFARPVSAAYARQAQFVLAMAGPGRAAPALAASPSMEGGLTGLGGADVLLVFVEAYGAVTYDHPTFAGALAPSRADLAAAARDAGREVLSAFVESPTFGASSWLAHLTLLTGVEVRDQYAYVAVMASPRDTLARAFRRHGYRSVALMPGMRQAWPEGAFYGFDHIYGRESLAYTGPSFGWWSIPDQYAMAKLDALELNGRPRAPRFVVFPTSTTHAPFGPVAPYQPDWPKVLTSEAFDPEEVDRAMSANPDLTNLSPSYLRAMAYEFTTFAGYVREHAGDNQVLILIGDHQPVAAVSGRGAGNDVPIHVIANAGAMMDRLRAAGFTAGIQPSRAPIGPMHGLVPVLLEAFAAEDDAEGGIRR